MDRFRNSRRLKNNEGRKGTGSGKATEGLQHQYQPSEARNISEIG
jgi:hypothetical protein